MAYTNFLKENHKELKKLRKEAKHLNKEIRKIQDNIPDMLQKFKDNEMESGHSYVQVVAYMKEMCNSLVHIINPAYDHLNNNHAMDKEQSESLKHFYEKSSEFMNLAINILQNKSSASLDELSSRRDEMIDMINDILVIRIKILKKTQKGVKLSVTLMEMLAESKKLFLDIVHLVKANATMQKSIVREAKDIDTDLLD